MGTDLIVERLRVLTIGGKVVEFSIFVQNKKIFKISVSGGYYRMPLSGLDTLYFCQTEVSPTIMLNLW